MKNRKLPKPTTIVWRPMDDPERLEQETSYLVVDGNGVVGEANGDGKRVWWIFNSDIDEPLAWAPMPYFGDE